MDRHRHHPLSVKRDIDDNDENEKRDDRLVVKVINDEDGTTNDELTKINQRPQVKQKKRKAAAAAAEVLVEVEVAHI